MTKRTLGLTLIAAALAGVPTGASAPSPARDAGPTDPHRREHRLSDGRTLAYADVGPLDARPILHMHGAPSSRLEARLDPAVAAELRVRIIAPDRPGIGGSSFQRHRRLEDWPGNVEQLADSLGLERFAVLGASAGGPYALACAAQLPDRVAGVGLVAATAPVDAPGVRAGMEAGTLTFWGLARTAPLALETFFRVIMAGSNKSDAWVDTIAGVLPEPDRGLFRDPDFRAGFAAMFKEAFRQGPRGPVHDIACIGGPWRVDPAAIQAPVLLWQGERDSLLAAGRHLAGVLPNCQATFYPDEGHLSLPRNHHRDILSALAATVA